MRIEIIDPRDDSANLALALRREYGLESVTLVPHGHKSDELTRRAVAAETAKFIDTQLRDGDVLGLGWGRTTSRMVDLLAPTKALSIDVVPLLGESRQKSTYSQMNHLILRTAQHFGGRPHFLLAPMVVGSRELRDLLSRGYGRARGRRAMGSHDPWLVSASALLPPTPGMIVYVGDAYAPLLMSSGAVGDICVHPFDQGGEILETPLTDCLIGVSVEQLRLTPCRIAVASGIEKANAVNGALRTGADHTFVC